MSNYLTNEQVRQLNEKHGWFEFGDAQSDVSKAFAQDAIAMYLAATEAAKATGTTKLPPPDYVAGTKGMLCEDTWARETVEAYGQQCAEAARQPAPVVAVTRIDTGYGNYLEFERKTTGKSGWLVRTESGDLVRALNPTEVLLVDSALAATAAPVLSDAYERDNEIFELQKALAFWLPQVNQFMSDEMSQRIARDAYMLVIDGNLPDDFKTAQELGWILPATGKVQMDAEMVCGNCMEPIPTTVMDISSTRAPAAALSDESIDELAKPLMEQCVIVYGDMRRFARAILAATNRSQP